MSVSSQTPVPGQSAQAAGSDPAGESEAAFHDPAGLLLARLTVLPTLAATAFLVAGFPLLLAGWFRPVPVIALSVIVAAAIVPLGLRRLPGVAGGGTARDSLLWRQPGDSPRQPAARATPWWTVAALLLIAVGFFAFQAAYHSQFIIITRDPGSYMQFATWIAGHGSLPIQTNSQDFGNAPGLWFQSFAMYQVGNSVVPQFMAGLPMSLAVGFWAGGVNAALLLGPFFGAVAIVVFGGLAARLLGARWAPLAALVLAASLPQMFTSRSTYSEPLSQILFLGGLALVIDALRAGAAAGAARAAVAPPRAASWAGLRARVAGWDSGQVIAALAGLAFGTDLLVRIDSPADVLPLIPYCGLLWLRGQRLVKPLLVGLAVGWALGWTDAVFLSRPYVFQTNKAGTIPLIEIIVATILATIAGVVWLRRRQRAAGFPQSNAGLNGSAGPDGSAGLDGSGLPQIGGHWWLPGWLPRVAVIAPFVVIAAFALRSHVQPNYVKEHYAQLTLHWVYWYLGAPAIALATIGTAALAYGCLRGRLPAWPLPLMSLCWGIVYVLYLPAITPDQPWASRRLVPAVLPGFILLSLWLVAWACGLLRRGEAPVMNRISRLLAGNRRPMAAAGVASVCALLLVVPAAAATSKLAFKRTYGGQVAAIYGLCARIPSGSSVIIVDSPLADRIAENVRGMCDVPVARFHYTGDVYKNPTAPTAQVLGVIAGVVRAGRRPVLLSAAPGELAPFRNGGAVTKAVTMRSTLDGRALLSPPVKIAPENLDVWMWEPNR
jgi:hypothetical protein